ncbi:exocyst complex component EXO70B2-like [Lolium rigidum]|uniref:exocyst complex component EXO70B2-like n=1 Tax=Lolium rigidum TaxID=89674 RepID=UPI001F5DCA83|nr:exocyst complex component EXO70B2-like [Lolium rigidum]
MAGRLATVPEESADGSTAAYPPRGLYLDLIRSIAVSGAQIRSTLFSHSGESGSSYSSGSRTSGSYPSHDSGCSSGSNSGCSAGAVDFGTNELTKIAQRMVSDGYTQRIIKAFKYDSDRALEAWFVELDVDWVLQRREGHTSRQQLQLEDKSAWSLQELVNKWIRALTVIVMSIKELVESVGEESTVAAVARFGQASISAMLVFVDTVVDVYEVEKLQAVLHTYICVSSASYDIFRIYVISPKVQSIFKDICGSLDRESNKLIGAISTMMKGAGMLLEDNDDLWAMEGEILRGGDVHRNIQWLVDYIVLMKKARDSTQKSAQCHNSEKLGEVISDSVDYLKDLLQRKSELCSDPSLRYLFLLNNSYFIAQMSEPSTLLDIELLSVHHWGLKHMPECQKHMDSYLEVSWGHVVSCISTSNFRGLLRRWINTSSLAKFQSAFHKTYQAQKFWKVPDPQLRSLLRETITKRVIPGYRDYLKGHPELEKQVSGGSSSPDELEEMLGELFEG